MGGSALTPECVDRICATIAEGHYATTACACAGIHRATYYRWLERAETYGEDSPYAEFRRRVRLAEAERERLLLALVREGATPHGGRPGDWRAAAWMLERILPERYGPTATIRHEASIDHTSIPPAERRLEALSDDDLDALERILSKIERRESPNGSARESAQQSDQLPALRDAGIHAELASRADCIEASASESGGDQASDN